MGSTITRPIGNPDLDQLDAWAQAGAGLDALPFSLDSALWAGASLSRWNLADGSASAETVLAGRVTRAGSLPGASASGQACAGTVTRCGMAAGLSVSDETLAGRAVRAGSIRDAAPSEDAGSGEVVIPIRGSAGAASAGSVLGRDVRQGAAEDASAGLEQPAGEIRGRDWRGTGQGTGTAWRRSGPTGALAGAWTTTRPEAPASRPWDGREA